MQATLDRATDIQLLFQEWDAKSALRDETVARLEMDSGDQIKSTPGMPHESKEHQTQRPRFAARFATALLNKLSYLYASEPVREASDESPEPTPTLDAAWSRVLWKWGPRLTPLMRQIDRDARLTGGVLSVMALGSSTPPTAEGKGEADGVEVWPITPDRWVKLDHPQDIRYPACVLVHWGMASVAKVVDGVQMFVEEAVYLYLDETHRIYITGRSDIAPRIEEHGYGTLPVAIANNTLKTVDGIGLPIGGADFLTNIRTIALMLEEIVFTGMLQRGQPVGVGKKIENQNLGPNSIVFVEDVGGFTIIGNGANVPAMLDTLNAQLEALSIGEGMPPGTLTVREAQTPANAGVVAAMQLELQLDRNVREGLARGWELDIARVASKIWATAPKGRALPSDWKIIYTRLPEPLTHAEKMAEAAFLREANAMDRLEAIRFAQPSKTLAEATKQRDDALIERKDDATAAALIAGHARDVGVMNGETTEPTETEPLVETTTNDD